MKPPRTTRRSLRVIQEREVKGSGEEVTKTSTPQMKKRGRPPKVPREAGDEAKNLPAMDQEPLKKKLRFREKTTIYREEYSDEEDTKKCDDQEDAASMSFPPTPYPCKTGVSSTESNVKATNSKGKIPRPPNVFMIFGKDNRKLMATQHPGSSNKDISRFLGEKWKSLSEEERTPYKEQASKALEEHKKKFPNYSYSPMIARLQKQDKKQKKGLKKCKCRRSESGDDSDFDEANKENIPPKEEEPQQVAPQGPRKVIKELFVAPPGYEQIEVDGLEKFVLWENKLIPYAEWVKVDGDIKKLGSSNFSIVPDELLQPIANCIVAGSATHAAANAALEESRENVEGKENEGSSDQPNLWPQDDLPSDNHLDMMTLNECNGIASSEGDFMRPIKRHPDLTEGSESDAQCILQNLFGGGSGATVVVQEVQSAANVEDGLFWPHQNVTDH